MLIRISWPRECKCPCGISSLLTHWPHICPSAQGPPHRKKWARIGQRPLGSIPGRRLPGLPGSFPPASSDLSPCSPGSCGARELPQLLGDGGEDHQCLLQGEISLGSVRNSLTPELAVGWRAGVQRRRPEVTVRCQVSEVVDSAGISTSPRSVTTAYSDLGVSAKPQPGLDFIHASWLGLSIWPQVLARTAHGLCSKNMPSLEL